MEFLDIFASEISFFDSDCILIIQYFVWNRTFVYYSTCTWIESPNSVIQINVSNVYSLE